MTVETLIEDPHWNDVGLAGMAEVATTATLAHLALDPEQFEISLMGCDDTRIAALNADFRGKPAPTNVLSWPAGDLAVGAPGTAPEPPEPGELGDIAIAWDTCAREAAEAGTPIDAHVTHLLVHATLHLLGYDHIADEDAALMEGLEVEILATLGLPDPYRDVG